MIMMILELPARPSTCEPGEYVHSPAFDQDCLNKLFTALFNRLSRFSFNFSHTYSPGFPFRDQLNLPLSSLQ